MAANAGYLDDLIAKVQDERIRGILAVTERTRKYPKDAITDGALQILVNYIIELEMSRGQKSVL